MEFVILTGMSGAGKTYALHVLEDFGYYCVDNLPPALLDTFYDLCENSVDNRMKKTAVVADSRSGNIYYELAEILKTFKIEKKRFSLLFLDSNDQVLLKRYKETRRKHPLLDIIDSNSTEEAITLEFEIVRPIREMADYVIDTSDISSSQLRERMQTVFTSSFVDNFRVTCVSFGFKHGTPREADIVIDVRCLPNPYYVPHLKNKTGLDKEVRDYVMDSEVSEEFLKRLYDFLDFALPQYKREGKSELVIGIGCTGGQHRSITIARLLNSHFIDKSINSSVHHRDIWKA